MVKAKRNLCSLLIAILLLGVATIPVTAEEREPSTSTKITVVEKSSTRDVIYGEATERKLTMYGYLYITVSWERESGVTSITGVEDAWTTDPYMELEDTWYSSSRGTAYFWDDTHHVSDHVTIYAEDI